MRRQQLRLQIALKMLKHVRQPVTIKIASVRMVARPVMRNVRSVVPPRIRNASPAARNQALRQLVRLGHIPWPYKRRAEATAACPSPTQMRAIIKSTYRATRQSEKAKLTVLQQLESGGFGAKLTSNRRAGATMSRLCPYRRQTARVRSAPLPRHQIHKLGSLKALCSTGSIAFSLIQRQIL